MTDELEILARILDKRTLDYLRDISIFKDQTANSYIMYGEYEIKKENNSYIVVKCSSDIEKTFSSIKYAVAWVIFDKRNMIYQSTRLCELEYRLVDLEVSMKIHKKMKNNTKDTTSYLLYTNKLAEDKLKHKKYLAEIDRYINDVHHWQLKQFSHKMRKQQI